MGIEIERKFLVRDERWRDAVAGCERMAQGYLGGERASVRVRLSGRAGYLNIKSRTRGSARLEFEYPIPPEDAEQLLAELCLPGSIVKTRHLVNHRGHLWEIDEFAGDNAGLIVAEIELSAVDEAFERPEWLGNEVTDDIRYYNSELAQHPYCEWGVAPASTPSEHD